MDSANRITEIDKEIQELYATLKKMDDEDHPDDNTFEGFEERREPVHKKLGKLSREKRLLMTPEYDTLPDYGSVMSMKDFLSCVRSGGFIDYDGHGCYVKDGKISNINIYPSDVAHKAVRKDFDTIIWFNR